MPDFHGSVDFGGFQNILGYSCDLSRSEEKIFITWGEGGLKNLDYEIE